ncbi:cytochrome P450, putative [Talaromyces stipitatus ATCC 10500]|uniref:Cytochrome P450, putative n=1 Tax=Talaromyces stipitatus (strain ATCC 10500 / CBS 375.48 / QM 6759 / NRRL 1006) TaxID=441959 RepID=B8ML89_TALSN|nr:cytochrome P450, putative [Talaromyces stipitatus ATCC 10500]EED15004.1 cytochrome P450, putative [Talaromyces stipitatus ATCC 10500]
MDPQFHQAAPPHNLIQTAKENAEQYSLFVLVAILIFSVLSTRTITGLQSQSHHDSVDGEPRRVRKLPYWVPGLGHVFSYSWRHRDFLLDAQKAMNDPVVALQMGLQTQYLVYSPNMIQKLINNKDARSGVYFTRVMENFVGDNGAFGRLSAQTRESVKTTLASLTQEKYLSKFSLALARLLERETADFVSFNRSLVDQMVWERNTGIVVEENNGTNSQSCQVDLFALTRSFASYHITYVLMGQALLDFHPGIVDDLSSWDQEYVRLIAGAPRWIPSPGISAAYAARDRVQKTISVLQASFSALEDGRNAPLEFRDLDDVSEIVQERMRFWRISGISSSLSARLDAWLLWKTTTDASKLIFWNILHIFSDSDLLATVRKEIAPYVRVTRSDPKVTGLPIAEPPRLSIDTEKLFTGCPLLKATYAETIRLDSNPISYRQLNADLTLTESEEDAAIFARENEKHHRSYKIFKDGILGLASGAHHIDSRYYREPKSFLPHRFLTTSASFPPSSSSKAKKNDEDQPSHSFNWQTVLPFAGDGTFNDLLEREVMLITASIVSLWDIESVESDQKGWGKSKIPAHRLSANAFLPSSDVKVRLKRHV